MSDHKRTGPDRTIILRIPREAPLSQAIDIAAVRACKSAPQYCKDALATLLRVPSIGPIAQPCDRRAREARQARAA